MGLAVRKLDAEALPAVESTSLPAGGGRPPRRRAPAASNAVLGTAIFLGTETMVFAALISAFLILRAGAEAWPPPGQPRLPVEVTALNTAVLLFSGYTMWRALDAERRRQRRRATAWLAATVALGVSFLAVQGSEWIALLSFGLEASSSLYGATFYTLIGCHAVHVLAAVGVVVILGVGMARGARAAEAARRRLEACGLYWSFVVAVWPVLYVLVYLT